MELWPRHYAAKILAANSRKERQAILDEVPERFKEWVKKIVVNEFELRKYRK